MIKNQKNIFLKYEGNRFFERNKKKLKLKDYSKDKITQIINSLKVKKNMTILEIGCCAGDRLNYLKKIFPHSKLYGIDPSEKAIKSNNNNKIILKRGTADNLNFPNDKFDIIIVGFCLYLCDDDDLFKIANEIFKKCKNKGYIIIEDFITKKTEYLNYSYNKHIKSRKMNYIKMFDWHPNISFLKKFSYQQKKKHKKLDNTVSIALLLKST